MAGDLVDFFGDTADVHDTFKGVVVLRFHGNPFGLTYTIPKFVTILVRHDDELL